MTQWHHNSKRKRSGGIRTTVRSSDKKLAWKGNDPANTTVVAKKEDEKIVKVRARGNVSKQKLAKAVNVNLSDGKKTVQGTVLSVGENKANRLFTRRNIVTKGAFIRVQVEGKEKTARVTSRPGQNGALSAVIVEGMPENPKATKAQKAGQKSGKKAVEQAAEMPKAAKTVA